MYCNYWGKAKKNTNDMHLLPYHCLDVASVMDEWIMRNRATVEGWSNEMEMSFGLLRGLLLFFSSLHDVGKFSITFQNLRPELLHVLQNKNSIKKYNIKHDQLGWILWKNVLQDCFAEKIVGSKYIPITDLLDVFACASIGHHGTPPTVNVDGLKSLFSESDINASKGFMSDLLDLFIEDHHLCELKEWSNKCKETRKKVMKFAKKISWQISGIVVLADWVSSGELCTYKKDKESIVSAYKEVRQRSKSVFNKIGMYSSKRSKESGFKHLYPDYNPTPLQKACDEIELSDGPQLFILEDITGAGKTESACTLASRIVSENIADGVFVALPTMATSNAMYERTADIYHSFFLKDHYPPSLMLCHGARHLSKKFSTSKYYGDINDSYAKIDDYPKKDQPFCASWLSNMSKKSLLADVGVGTLDQLLLGTLKMKYQSLRILGMSTKVLIVDEVHAYDAYMMKIFETVIKHHANIGCPIILLSATLSYETKKRIAKAFYEGLSTELPEMGKSNAFPSITKMDKDGTNSISLLPRKESVKSIPVEFLDSLDTVLEKVKSASDSGKCVCWIRNTISDVVDGYYELKNKGVSNIHVFHSRFTLSDRLEIEFDVCRKYGKNSKNTERSGQVLIASQVVEQSLDLDFDVLISDLTYIDLLIQRAGRSHRHMRDKLGNPSLDGKDYRDPQTFYIYGPQKTKDPSSKWYSDVFQFGNYVYPNNSMLWKTKEVLENEGEIRLPDRARYMIEYVYGDNIDTPDVFIESENKVKMNEAASKDHAAFNTIDFEGGYSPVKEMWGSEGDVKTRESNEQRSIYLVKFSNGKILPYHSGALDYSMIKMQKISSDGNVQYNKDMQKGIDIFLENNEKVDKGSLFLIANGNMEWDIEKEKGASYVFKYDSVLGLFKKSVNSC